MVTAAALVSGLVAGVTLHYLGSPCLVRPHPLVTANISAVVARGMRAGAEVARDTEEEEEGEAILLENWTRWRLQLDSGETVPPHSAVSLAQGVRTENRIFLHSSLLYFLSLIEQRFPLVAWFSWRPDYKERLSVEPETGAVEAEASKPWYSRLGIYHHYTLQVRPGSGSSDKIL